MPEGTILTEQFEQHPATDFHESGNERNDIIAIIDQLTLNS